MKEYEVHVFASYVTEGGSKEWNVFKEYVKATSEAEAKKLLKSDLKAEGYRNIKMEAIEV